MSERFKFGICIWDVPAEGPDTCAVVSQYGLDGMELDMGDWKDGLPLGKPEIQAKYRNAGKEHGIVFPTLGANTLCDHGMSKTENTDIVRSIFETMVSTAVSLEIPKLQIASFFDGFINNEEEFLTTVDNLRYICDIAGRENLIIGIENAISVKENQRLLALVNKPNLRYYFDTSNPFWFGDGMHSPSMIHEMADQICEYHVKDEIKDTKGNVHFSRLGEGRSTFMEASAAILVTDYEGWILLENDY